MQNELTKAIAADLGLTHLSLAEQQQLITRFSEVALKAATVSVLEKMTVDKRGEFAKLAEAGDPTAIKIFLDREVPGHESVAKEAVVDEVQRFKEFQAA